MNDNKVTVIMPIYNVAPYLSKCIESVLSQSYENFELFLVDDGSKDESPKIIDKYATQDNRISPVHQVNSGVDAARNVGLEKGTGKYVAFIDSDDWYEKEYLEKLVSTAEVSNAQMVVCNFEPVGVDNPPKVKDIGECTVDKISAMRHLLGYNSFNGYVWNKLFLMSIIRENNLRFQDGYWACDDVLYAGDYIYYCDKITVINNKLYYYRQNNAGANRVRYSRKVDFDKKWMSSFSVTKHFRELFDNSAVTTACKLHEVREASIVLRSMAAGGYKGKEYYQLRKIIKDNIYAFFKSDEARYTQKLSVFLTAISPKLELKVWKIVNKVR